MKRKILLEMTFWVSLIVWSCSLKAQQIYTPREVQLSGLHLNNGSYLFGEIRHRYSNGKYFVRLANETELFLKDSEVKRVEKLNKIHLIKGSRFRSIIVKGRYNILRYNVFYSRRSSKCCQDIHSITNIGSGLVFISGYQWKERFGFGIGVGRNKYPILSKRVYTEDHFEYYIFYSHYGRYSYRYGYKELTYFIFPVFIDIRGLVLPINRKTSLSYSLQFGFEFPLVKDFHGISEWNPDDDSRSRIYHNGFFINPSIGFRLPTYQRYNFEFELGYRLFWLKVTDMQESFEEENHQLLEHGLVLSFGIVF